MSPRCVDFIATTPVSDFRMPCIVGFGLLLSGAVPLRLWDGVQTSQVPTEEVRACLGS